MDLCFCFSFPLLLITHINQQPLLASINDDTGVWHWKWFFWIRCILSENLSSKTITIKILGLFALNKNLLVWYLRYIYIFNKKINFFFKLCLFLFLSLSLSLSLCVMRKTERGICGNVTHLYFKSNLWCVKSISIIAWKYYC